MKCPGCGERNDERYRFCRRCGRGLGTREARRSPAAADGPASPQAGAAKPAEAPPTYKLLALKGLLAGRTFSIGPAGLAIGRDSASCQVVIADDEISRLHAWIGMNEQGAVVVRDRHSANGTFVNKVRVQERELRATDELCFGTGRRHLFRIARVDGTVRDSTGAPAQAGRVGPRKADRL